MPLQATSGAASYDAFGGGVPFEPTYIEQIFSTFLYTGNGSTQTITNGIDLAGEGGLIWFKRRSGATGNTLYDTARGVNFSLSSNLTSANINKTGDFSSFNSDGFTIGVPTVSNDIQSNTATFASWTFRKQPKFFDVVTYTGDGVAGRTVAHNLGSVPGCIIVKRTDTTADWQVYHRSLGATETIQLNSTNAAASSFVMWNSTAPTSTVFSVGAPFSVNQSGGTYVAYLFAHDAGGFGLTGTDNVISCGSFTTDGSGNATVNLGYEPQWVLIKKTDEGSNWMIHDSMRGMSLTTYAELRPNTSDAENAGVSEYVVPQATGFKAIISQNNPFIYIAIRRGPMKVPTTGTSVFNGIARAGTGAAAHVVGVGFAPDLVFPSLRSSFGAESGKFDRLRGVSRYLVTNSGVAEGPDNSLLSFNMDGISLGATSTSYINGGGGYTYINHFFRRAPGFLDQICYTGTGVARTVAHNLAAVPELMIVKGRSGTTAWQVYSSALANTQYLVLNTTAAVATGATRWNSTRPTSSVFSLGTASEVNGSSSTYVAYLFATCPGVSKVGSFTGTGATQIINCGFTGGARFVLIKATSTTGSWYVWDSARGIVAGNDPYILLNSADAEVTNTDWVDTAATGFELSNAGGNLANSNGVSYIFLAIA